MIFLLIIELLQKKEKLFDFLHFEKSIIQNNIT